jgi:excinuclease ABC subunit C
MPARIVLYMAVLPDKVQQKLKALPTKPGCYIYKAADGEVLYVGKALNLRNRVRSYFQKSTTHTVKVRRMVARIADLDLVVTDSELEALILECNLIKELKPYYNVRLRDDKQYPYLVLTLSEPYPRLLFTRRVHKGDGNRYFGPYTNSRAVWDSLRLIYKLFPLVTCRKKWDNTVQQRPCLYHHMGRCPHAPCAGLANQEQYRQAADDVALFLEGRQDLLVRKLRDDMTLAADNLEFEHAARLRDQIQAVDTLIQRQKVLSLRGGNQDVVALVADQGQMAVQMFFIRNGKLIGQEHFMLEGEQDADEIEQAAAEFVKQYYQDASDIPSEIILPTHLEETEIIEQWLKLKKGAKVTLSAPERGEKRHLLDMAAQNARLAIEQMRKNTATEADRTISALIDLQEALNLDDLPERIEAYDISTLQGVNSVAGMVVFERGKPAKSEFRKFRIKLPEQAGAPNDFAMMHETITRRLTEANKGNPKFQKMPDLMLIDGGKGQLSSALAAANETGWSQLSMIGLAKQYELIFVPGRQEPLVLPKNSQALFLLQRIRDEVHRFSVTYHRTVRSVAITASHLDTIAGIGASRKRELLKLFGSVDRLKAASLEDIACAPSMNMRAARSVYNSLHGSDEAIEDQALADGAVNAPLR